MMPLPTIYTDEDVPDMVGDQLVTMGFTVYLARDVAYGADDSSHLKHCSDDGSVMVTLDRKDFWRLHWLWMSMYAWNVLDRMHTGILTVKGRLPPLPNEWAPAIDELVRDRAGNLAGMMWEWSSSKGDWSPIPLKLP